MLDTLTGQLQEGLFPNMGTAYNSADAPLWFFWVLQQLAARTSAREVWERYGHYMKEILAAYRKGIGEVVRTDRNGLVRASHPSLAMTWMDAVVDGRPVTGRDGYQVEINALWYNAVCYTLELAEQFGDRQFVEAWHDIPALVRDSFLTMFWYDDGGYLADYVAADGTQNTFIRPNQVLACSLAYKMPDEAMQLSVLDTVRQHLLTSRGLRRGLPSGNGMGMAARTLCQGEIRPARSSFRTGSRRAARRLRGGYQQLRHRLGTGDIRRRPAPCAARCHLSGLERRGAAPHPRHD